MAEQIKRYDVSLTEAQIDALIVSVGNVRIVDVHACRIRATHEGLTELKHVQSEIRINKEAA